MLDGEVKGHEMYSKSVSLELFVFFLFSLSFIVLFYYLRLSLSPWLSLSCKSKKIQNYFWICETNLKKSDDFWTLILDTECFKYMYAFTVIYLLPDTCTECWKNVSKALLYWALFLATCQVWFCWHKGCVKNCPVHCIISSEINMSQSVFFAACVAWNLLVESGSTFLQWLSQ